MKLSKRTRYGLHALIDLVIHAKTEQIALNSIAQRNGISEQYLEQVFSALRRARIVKSVKGAQGGYFLKKIRAILRYPKLLKSWREIISWKMRQEEQKKEEE